MRGEMYVSIEFADDPNVAGRTYWYLCEFKDVDVGSFVMAPIGRHDKLQEGIVRRVMFAEREYAPFPREQIKRVDSLATKLI